jgi:hypothetical protein
VCHAIIAKVLLIVAYNSLCCLCTNNSAISTKILVVLLITDCIQDNMIDEEKAKAEEAAQEDTDTKLRRLEVSYFRTGYLWCR